MYPLVDAQVVLLVKPHRIALTPIVSYAIGCLVSYLHAAESVPQRLPPFASRCCRGLLLVCLCAMRGHEPLVSLTIS